VRLIQRASHVYSHEIICVEVSSDSSRRSLGRRLPFDLSHFNWHRCDSPPRLDNQEDEGTQRICI